MLMDKVKYISKYCYIDTDVVVNPFAKSVFSVNSSNKLSLVRQFRTKITGELMGIVKPKK
jgi:hypothetical protein